jgi:transposase, IS6 family
MLEERGVEVDPATIMLWGHRYAPELEKRVRWYQGYPVTSWRVDETYIKVGGRWKYLFRAVGKHGQSINFMLTDRRNRQAAQRFLAKALIHPATGSPEDDGPSHYPALTWGSR